MSGVAWVIKSDNSAFEVTFTSGWPWVKDSAGKRTLTDGCSGDRGGFISLESTDRVIVLHQGGEFTPEGPILGRVKIGR